MVDVGEEHVDGGARAYSCPRCGYDLSGHIPRWKESGETDTRCAECGLEHVLRLIEHPSFRIPEWSFEHAMFRRTRALISTMRQSLRPRRFWEQMPIEAPIRVNRLAQYVAASAFLALIGFVALIGVRTLNVYFDATPKPGPSAIRIFTSPRLFRAPLAALRPIRNAMHPSLLRSLAWAMLFPLTLLCLPQTFRKGGVRPLQILRVAAYSIWPVVFLYGLVVWRATTVEADTSTLSISWFSVETPWAISFPVVIWLWVYWYRALGTYLRLPTPGLIVGLNLLMAFLAATVLAGGIVGWADYAWMLDW